MQMLSSSGIFLLHSTDHDYEIIQTNNIVRIPSGMQSAVFRIDIENDDIVEGIERFSLGLSQGSVSDTDEGKVNTDNQQTVVFIEDNDGKLVITLHNKRLIKTECSIRSGDNWILCF